MTELDRLVQLEQSTQLEQSGEWIKKEEFDDNGLRVSIIGLLCSFIFGLGLGAIVYMATKLFCLRSAWWFLLFFFLPPIIGIRIYRKSNDNFYEDTPFSRFLGR